MAYIYIYLYLNRKCFCKKDTTVKVFFWMIHMPGRTNWVLLFFLQTKYLLRKIVLDTALDTALILVSSEIRIQLMSQNLQSTFYVCFNVFHVMFCLYCLSLMAHSSCLVMFIHVMFSFLQKWHEIKMKPYFHVLILGWLHIRPLCVCIIWPQELHLENEFHVSNLFLTILSQ